MDKADAVRIYMEYYPATTKKEIMPFAATWMDMEIVTVNEVSQRQISYSITYTWNLKECHKLTYLLNSNRFTHFDNELMVTREGDG